jgi:hypothetical protein
MVAKINLRTGKIIGAEKGSFAWWHEKGHIAYDDSEEGISAGVNQNNAIYCSFIFLALGQFFLLFEILAICSVVVIIYYFLYEEHWCNNYAGEKMKGGKKKQNGNRR